MLEDDSLVTEAKVEALLSCLVSPAAEENPAAAALARTVLQRREREVQPTLQRLLTRLLTSPLTANSALCEQSYALVAQVGAGRGGGASEITTAGAQRRGVVVQPDYPAACGPRPASHDGLCTHPAPPPLCPRPAHSCTRSRRRRCYQSCRCCQRSSRRAMPRAASRRCASWGASSASAAARRWLLSGTTCWPSCWAPLWTPRCGGQAQQGPQQLGQQARQSPHIVVFKACCLGVQRRRGCELGCTSLCQQAHVPALPSPHPPPPSPRCAWRWCSWRRDWWAACRPPRRAGWWLRACSSGCSTQTRRCGRGGGFF
jgi:hypothetical protein